MMKKMLVLLLALLMCASVFLTACDGDDGETPGGDTTTDKGEDIPPVEDRDLVKIDKGTTYKLEDTFNVFQSGFLQSTYYRIPSMVTTKNGVVVAAIDRGHNPDYGNISLAIRRSLDGGKTWDDGQVLLDPPAGSTQAVVSQYHPLVIDPSMVYDAERGRITLIISLWPESLANFEQDKVSKCEAGTGYKEVDGEMRLILRNYTAEIVSSTSNPTKKAIKRTYTEEYTVGSDGVVYDKNNKKTAYTMPSFHDGILYKDGKENGNIFIYSGGKNKADLSVVPTQYLIEMHSDDDGKTWSDAVCLNTQVKPDANVLLGTGPGVGIVTYTGRYVVPMWDNTGVCTIYSDDGGESWSKSGYIYRNEVGDKKYHISEAQVVELRDDEGKPILKLFGRSNGSPYIATSTNNGKSWKKAYIEEELDCPDCQITVLALPFDVQGYEGKQLVLYAGANGKETTRTNGTLWVGVYDPEEDSFEWIKKKVFTGATYMYSILTVLPDNRIGILYEESTTKIVFTAFHIGFLLKK